MDEYTKVYQRILRNATKLQYEALEEQSHYHAPFSYWSFAKDYGLCTPEEFDAAKEFLGKDLWFYVGD